MVGVGWFIFVNGTSAMTVSLSRTFLDFMWPLKRSLTTFRHHYRSFSVASLSGALWLVRRAVRHVRAARLRRGQGSRSFSDSQGNWRVTQQRHRGIRALSMYIWSFYWALGPIFSGPSATIPMNKKHQNTHLFSKVFAAGKAQHVAVKDRFVVRRSLPSGVGGAVDCTIN